MPRLLVWITLLLAPLASADDPLDNHLENPQVIGEASFNYMFWHLYDIALYASHGEYSEEPPFALSIRYSRSFPGSSIADRSSQLIRRQGVADEMRLAGWHRQMDEIFPDVEEGTVLLGLLAENGHTLFYRNGEEIGRIKDPLFGQYFFDIWLGEDTTEPALRRKLLGSVLE